MAKSATAPTVTKVSLRLPENIYDHYYERAAKFGREIEDEINLRLRDCRDHTAASGIYLDDAARNELSQLAGKLIRTPDDLLAWAKTMSTLHVEGVDIPLSTMLATRLRTRCFGHTWPEHIRKTVTELLEQSAGMR